ncbi:MAG: NAD(P)H-dependent glycerol-3-phosphate dehydrogenase [Sulfurospirillaceae bacterium]|nr:NAD(P)H-dependent glycerol-3-phosphate dehydrogenase [Sulfurospirillaceae bacterium]MDD3462852.1 NAD(P)H-dependent glycerol-3-phosphate dehydrogenase [Sulfurospirillaceae bacterium]
MKIAVIGAGKWGQALHFAISQKQPCYIASRNKKEIENFVSISEALKAEFLIFALPAQVVGSWLSENFTNNGQKILVAAKGIEQGSGRFLNEIFAQHVEKENLAFLSGPSFASEVMQGLPTALVINSTCSETANSFCEFFPNFIKTYISNDVMGAEVCGAYKNVLAIASGVCDGLALGNNARASMIARGLVEMHRFGKYFGAHDETFLGLSGAGDLFLTATSALSRNYRVGFALAQGESIAQILKNLGEVAEGVFTSEAIEHLSQKHSIYTPIAHEIFLILKGKRSQDSVKDLLAG